MRLFTFGCSLTNYYYPTWSNIIAENFEQYQNWGKRGVGNNYILNAITRAHIQNHFVPNDTIIIMWSGLSRIDYFQINQWCSISNAYHRGVKWLDLLPGHDVNELQQPFSCPLGYQWLSFAWITAAQIMLQNLGVTWKMFTWQDLDRDTPAYDFYHSQLQHVVHSKFMPNDKDFFVHRKDQDSIDRELLDLYERLAGKDWPSLDIIMSNQWQQLPLSDFIRNEITEFLFKIKQHLTLPTVFNEIDYHPGPLSHSKWVEKYLPEYPISSNMRKQLAHIEHCLVSSRDFDFVVNEYQ